LALWAALVAIAGCAGSTPDETGAFITSSGLAGTSARLPVREFKPDGPGPFPAVVILHDCSGLGPTSSGAPRRWTNELVARGYVVLIPDSFTPRGHAAGVCTVPVRLRNADVGPQTRARDAHAALAHLRTLPYVDGRRIGVMGGSHGGSSTLAAMATRMDAVGTPDFSPFAAGIALYPACATAPRVSTRVYRSYAPLLILIGEKDDWTPAEPCRQLAKAAQAEGSPVSLKVYPGAHHSFDSHAPVRYNENRINLNAPNGRGATTGGDPAAWADSIREVEAFFGRHLKSAP
jgi:dienelactone hydrolase